MSWFDGTDFEDQDTKEPWSSIVDLMSSFTLVLFLAVTFFIINYNRASHKLKERQKRLDRVARQLSISLKDLKLKSASLKISKAEEARLQAEAARLAKKNLLIRQQMLTLSQKEKENLLERQRLLEERKKLLAEREQLRKDKQLLSALVDKKALLAKKNQQLIDQQKELNHKQILLLARVRANQQKCQEKLRQLLRLRQSVLLQIYKAFPTRYRQGKTPLIGFDLKTGKFRLGGEVLFGRAQATLTPEGRQQLKLVMDSLDRVIWKSGIRHLLSGIMVEGHTSSSGKEGKNWSLSSRRALSAVAYMLSLAKARGRHAMYARLLFAAGFGQYHPVLQNGKEDARRSRRIEVKILFKEQERIQNIVKQLKRKQTP